MAPDGPAWRRVVPSPAPVRLVEEPIVRQLLDAGVIVICGGGGGVPVLRQADGAYIGVQGVVDKDRTAAMIAIAMGAQGLLLLTDVSSVQRGFGTPAAQPLRTLDVSEIADLDLPPGSMLPKVEACAQFTRRTGHWSAIGALRDAGAVLRREAGTTITDLYSHVPAHQTSLAMP
jgi:carbamate kinase